MPVDFDRNVHCLLGLPFDVINMGDAIARMFGAPTGAPPYLLSTPNLNFLVACQDDHEFRASVIGSDLSIADGMPLVWMARLLGLPLRERVAGSSLFEALRGDTERPLSVYFFGAPPGVAERACQRLNAEAGGLRCVGFECPGFGSIEDMSSEATIARINASSADFVVVALGARKGQAWIEHNRQRLSAPVISHLGAVVGFVAGTLRRAPRWMQESGLEWLWRIKEEPDLWRRYFGDGLALARLLATRVLPLAVYQRCCRPRGRDLDAPAIATAALPDGAPVLRLRGAWTADNLAPLRSAFAALTATDADIRLDLREVAWIDSAVVGLLLMLHGHAARRDRRFALEGTSRRVRRLLELHCAGSLLNPV